MKKDTDKGSIFSIILVFITLSLIGIAFLPLVNIQLSPSEVLPTIKVKYKWPNASALIIEKEITSKLEGVLNSVSGIKEISSTSYKGKGSIKLSFKKNIDLDIARFEVSTLIRRIYPELPEQVSYPSILIGKNSDSQKAILTYTLSGSSTPFLIQKYAEDNISTKLSTIRGISEVKVYGANTFEWAVEVNSLLIEQLDISVNEIEMAINNYYRNDVIGLGNIDNKLLVSHDKTLRILLRNNRSNELTWRNLPIKKYKSRIIYLNDIAKVKYQEQLPDSYYRINGLNTINLVIYADEEINTLKVAAEAKQILAEIKGLLPTGYYLNLSNDTTIHLNKELKKIGLRSLYSLIILLLFVLLISRQFKYLILITVSLVLNLLIAAIFYYLLHVKIHLYSLAGITVSFGIIIDNSIVMIDHYRYHNNKKVFIAIFAATLTTIASLSVIFLLNEDQRLNLIDFVIVIIINLVVSLTIAWFFIPAFFKKLNFKNKKGQRFIKRKRKIVRFNCFFKKQIFFSKKYKCFFFSLVILSFGIPLHLLPKEIEIEKNWSNVYNKTIGSTYFTTNIRPIAEIVLGGSLRLFSEYVFENSYYEEPEQTKLYIRGKMPEGCTVQQLNAAIEKMENYISQFHEIGMFETSVYNYRNSSIAITFKKEYENASFPYKLKSRVTQKAIGLGGIDWHIYGVGKGFSNEISSRYKSNQIVLEGYNYNQLFQYATNLLEMLLENKRVKDPEITGQVNWGGNTVINELILDLDSQLLALNNISLEKYYEALKDLVFSSSVSKVFDGKVSSPVTIFSDRAKIFHSWWLKNELLLINKNRVKVSDFGKVNKRKTGNDIYKYNQQYRLIVAFDFVGPNKLADNIIQKNIDAMNNVLPIGYKAKMQNNRRWNKKNKDQYYLILLIIVIIYFICSILFESLSQPLAIIALIPISFIGVFLTFYLLDFNFDQGGIASFILLCGIVVNSGVYILNDFNSLIKINNRKNIIDMYIKAFNYKITSIFLTIASTMLGLIPFVWGGQNEVFWFAFAVGSLGGLIFSFIAIFLFFPLFLNLSNKTM